MMAAKGRHRKPKNRHLREIAVTAATVAVFGAYMTASPAQASEGSPVHMGNAALNWAESHAIGHPYVWGGAGPYGFDCSGTVVAAFAHLGISLPHNTVAMIQSGKLIRTYHPQRGDLAFWGNPYYPSHVEFVTRWHHVTFGAQHSGTVVWWHHWDGYWAPSSYWRIR